MDPQKTPTPAKVRVPVRDRVRTAAAWTTRSIGAGWKLGAQFAGGGAALAGLYVLTGSGWTLLVGGVALGAVGTLAELADEPAPTSSRAGGR
ncbi:hypothetical protein ACIBF5_09555 [Micromonospora sp. NPDC050417]|uniref:hypothetical protein n=1 Tax=Micromonospora sp. NPDC050417 TaxID=3364280 RepID=UPI0037886F80